ncbi:MAG: hypothetical protein AAF125_13290 [Chloroflexota bacterium]
MDNSIPETMNFLLLGLGSVLVFVGGYIASLVIRRRNLDKDMQLIQDLAQDD